MYFRGHTLAPIANLHRDSAILSRHAYNGGATLGMAVDIGERLMGALNLIKAPLRETQDDCLVLQKM
jgi:hypothetical protein